MIHRHQRHLTFSIRVLLLTYVALVTIAATGCTRRVSKTLYIHVSGNGSSDTGVLRITDQGDGVEWEMRNVDHRAATDTALRTGRLKNVTASDIEKGMLAATPPAFPPGRAVFHLSVESLNGVNRAKVLEVGSGDGKIYDVFLASTPGLAAIWKEATGIPKTYWYREVGPVSREHREVVGGG